jgi:predicted N-acyltransferase
MVDGSAARVDIRLATALDTVSRADWDALCAGGRDNPFVCYDFLAALETSGCVGERAGWTPLHLLAHDGGGRLVGAMPLYAKSHSYGEYVFDHAWADALHRAGGDYYPKLQCAAPFTPVTGPRLLVREGEDRAQIGAALAAGAINLAGQAGASSVHVTFCEESEQRLLGARGFLARTGVQFHWKNEGYADFHGFLAALSSNKRKNIRKERARAVEELSIRRLRGADITERDWDFFFRCYMDTGARKWGSPYLNRAFFSELAARMGDVCLLFVAEQDGAPIASALNLIGRDTLYGRYWGCTQNVPFLHFELCYYQAIDFAIEHGLARVEAGAQGEHKLLRGYEPVPTFSAHWIAHPGLRTAVAHFLERERPAVAEEIEQLEEHTPFKKGD